MLNEALVELALRPWGRPQAGVVVDRTPERLVQLCPNFPIPGPNCVSLIRCRPARVASVVAEARRLAASRGLTCIWIVDPDARPPDLPERLAALGMLRQEELAVMVLPAAAGPGPADVQVEIVDALGDAETFRAAEAVQAAAFGSGPAPGQDGRLADGRADPRRHFLLALLDGQPAGAGWATVFEEGVFMNGGAVDPRFRGRGVYRSMVAARLALARAAHARLGTSAPILARLGFTEAGRLRLLAESGTA